MKITRILLFVTFIKNLFGFLLPILQKLTKTRAGHYWQQGSVWQRRFVLNFVFGAIIMGLLHLFSQSVWLQDVKNMGMDWMMNLTKKLQQNDSELAFTLIDVDEDSHYAWGEPFYTPRPHLLDLIRFASEGGARLILVDIDLSRGTVVGQGLATYLHDYDDDSVAPIVLLRSLYPPAEHNNKQNWHLRPWYFTDAVGQNVLVAQPMFQQDKLDKMVRHWYLYAHVCDQGQARVLPSFQLLSYALLDNKQTHLADYLSQLSQPDCTDLKTANQQVATLDHADIPLSSAAQNWAQRIVYTLPWDDKTRDRDQLQIVPAFKIIESLKDCSNNPQKGCATDLVKNRIVVIGASNRDSHDWHLTPMGDMSGSLAIINAINSLHLFGLLHMPTWGLWLSQLIVLLLMAGVFARFNAVKGLLILSVSLALLLVPISYYFFKQGVWINFGLAVLLMQLLQPLVQSMDTREDV